MPVSKHERVVYYLGPNQYQTAFADARGQVGRIPQSSM